MAVLKFKSNISCSGCINTVTPVFNEYAGEGKWKVDTSTEDKIVEIDNDQVDLPSLENRLKKVGYHLEKVD